MREKFQRFMSGRYGNDQLSQFMLVVMLIMVVLNLFLRSEILSTLLLICLIICYFRMFSKNIQKRYNENVKFLNLKGTITGWFGKEKRMAEERKTFHIYTCPNCKQKIRVPKNKGKIQVTCPKCRSQFIKKS